MPYEGVFSKLSGRARYRGRIKVHFQALCEAIAVNFKRLLFLDVEPILLNRLTLTAERYLEIELIELKLN